MPTAKRNAQIALTVEGEAETTGVADQAKRDLDTAERNCDEAAAKLSDIADRLSRFATEI